MTNATSSKKKVTAPSNIDAVNIELRDALLGSLDLDGERVWFEEAIHLLNSGAISANGLRATLLEVEEVGTAPTIRSSHAQDLALAGRVYALEGAENQPLKKVINAAIQARKAFKKAGALELVESSITFADFVAEIPSQSERSTNTRGAGKENADEKKAGKKEKEEAVSAIAAPKPMTAQDMAVALAVALDKGEPITPTALENLGRALSRRHKAVKAA